MKKCPQCEAMRNAILRMSEEVGKTFKVDFSGQVGEAVVVADLDRVRAQSVWLVERCLAQLEKLMPDSLLVSDCRRFIESEGKRS